MKKLVMLMVLVVVFITVTATMTAIVPQVQAREEAVEEASACGVAASYGYNSAFHNLACYYEILMDSWLL